MAYSLTLVNLQLGQEAVSLFSITIETSFG